MALTKVSGGILDPGIDVAGIVTATGFDGPFTGGSSKNITAGIITATGFDLNGNGDISGNLVVGGNLTANGDFTTLNTTLREVELLRVESNSSAVAGIITQSGSGDILYLYDGSTEVFSVKDGGSVRIGDNASYSAAASADDLVIGATTGQHGLTILTGNNSSSINFADSAAVNPGAITYNHNGANYMRFRVAGSETVRILQGGEVGIGTTNPYTTGASSKHKLTVTGDDVLGIGRANGDMFYVRREYESGKYTFQTINGGNDGNFNFQPFGGAVGIGTKTPATKLHVTTTSASAIPLTVERTHNNNVIVEYKNRTASMYAGLAGDGLGWSVGNSVNLGAIANNMLMVRRATGNIGIGTLVPETNLTIAKNATNQTTATIPTVRLTNLDTTAVATDIVGSYEFFSKDVHSENKVTGFMRNIPTDAGVNYDLIFGTIKTGDSNAVEKLRINSTGQVKITGTDDQDNLVVNASSTQFAVHQDDTDGEISLRAQDGSGNNYAKYMTFFTQAAGQSAGERLRINTDGQVVINREAGAVRAASASKLEVFNDTYNTIYVSNSTAAADQEAGIMFAPANNTYGGQIVVKSDEDFSTNANRTAHMAFYTRKDGTAAERVRITSDGNVGIGLTNPNAPLEVKSSANTVGILTSTTNGANLDIYDDDTQLRIRSVSGKAQFYADVNNDVDESSFRFFVDGTVSSKEKLNIVGAGITVFGEIATEQDYPNFKPRLNFDFIKSKKLDPRFTYQRTGSASFTDEFGKVVLVGDNVPRFDHDPLTGECKGLLIEERRTNYVRNSLGLGSEWVAGSGSFALDNSITNPDGSVGAYHHTGAELYHENINLSGANTNVITVSLWVKERSGQSGNLDIQIYQQITGSVVVIGAFVFDPATKVIQTPGSNFSNGTVEEYPNGWYRISAKVTTSSGNFSSSTRLDVQGAEHYVWGFQVEVGEFLTSFIPTRGGIITRGYEEILIDGDDFTDFYNPIESTVICEFDSSNWLTYNNNRYERIWSINNGSESDVFEMFKSHTDNDVIRYRVRDGGSNVLGAANITYGTNTTPKMAFALKLNDAAVAVDGTITGTTDTGIPMPTVDRLIIGNDDEGTTGSLTGYVRKFSYYPVKLPDSQVVTLTS